MRHLIATRYAGPTKSRGSRIVAFLAADSRERVVVAYDHSLRLEENYLRAAEALASRLGVKVDPYAMPMGRGWGFVAHEEGGV